ncbi:unnamed protein product [Aphanomyces euteiches]
MDIRRQATSLPPVSRSVFNVLFITDPKTADEVCSVDSERARDDLSCQSVLRLGNKRSRRLQRATIFTSFPALVFLPRRGERKGAIELIHNLQTIQAETCEKLSFGCNEAGLDRAGLSRDAGE